MNENTYYAFGILEQSEILAALKEKVGDGFFYFNLRFKEQAQGIPISNTDPTPLPIPVYVLETDFSEENKELRLLAEQKALFYSKDNKFFLEWLNTPSV